MNLQILRTMRRPESAHSLKPGARIGHCLAKLAAMDGSSPERGSVSICFVEEALACIRERGMDADALLIQARISPELLSSPTRGYRPAISGRCGN